MPRPRATQPMFDGLDATVFTPRDGRARPGLYLEECSVAAARYAVENWHYSGLFPRAKKLTLGVWEDGRFVGTLVFCIPASNNLLPSFGLDQDAGLELARVALTAHRFPVSRMLRIGCALVGRSQRDLRLLVSFADRAQAHLGVIYQAAGWTYSGESAPSDEYIVGDRRYHGKALRGVRLNSPFRDVPTRNVAEWAEKVYRLPVMRVAGSRKFRYLWPLDPAMRAQITPLGKPYPKSCRTSADGGTSDDQSEGDGSSPIVRLLPDSALEEDTAAASR